MNWATKRQIYYFLGFMFVVLVFVGVPAFFIWYEKPSCADGKRNQAELGIDCGGPCVRLCKSADLKPVVVWEQTLEVSDNTYTAVAYVQNPNLTAYAQYAPYTFSIYDAQGTLLLTKTGATYIPPGRNFAVVEPALTIADAKPARTLFEFSTDISWYRAAKNEPEPVFKNQLLSNASTSPAVDVDIENQTFTDFPYIDIAAIAYDSDGNAFAASKTVIRDLNRQTLQHVVFTWPRPFPLRTEVCKVPTDIILGIDRSGSMASDGSNPPEPLTSVKNAAVSFVQTLGSQDQAGLISFATESSLDQPLTMSTDAVQDAINAISIAKTGTQYTNVRDTLMKAREEFQSERHNADSKKVLVLLTDGIANYPEKKGDATYGARLAQEEAHALKNNNIELYTIGLGQTLDVDFLKNLASSEKHYYSAFTSHDVEQVYQQVAQSLCQKQAARIELIATIPPVR